MLRQARSVVVVAAAAAVAVVGMTVQQTADSRRLAVGDVVAVAGFVRLAAVTLKQVAKHQSCCAEDRCVGCIFPR